MNRQEFRIVILSGSPRTESISHRIALHLEKRIQQVQGVNVQLVSMLDEALPTIQEVWKQENQVPADKLNIYHTMMKSDGYIVVSPEYNGGYSPALKNFLDHFPKSAYQRKAWGIVTGSTGAMGGMRASQQMQLLGVALSAIVCPRMLITPQMDRKFNEEGELMDDGFGTQIAGFMDDFLWLVRQLAVA